MIFCKNEISGLLRMEEIPVPYEKSIQILLEENLRSILGLEFVRSEFKIKNKRIDTLAFDELAKTFVIIEYKRSRNSCVVDQGWAYRGMLLQNKADVILEYNDCTGKSLRKNEVNWSACRVIFVSPDFTENQRLASRAKDLNIELWQIKYYENGLVNIFRLF